MTAFEKKTMELSSEALSYLRFCAFDFRGFSRLFALFRIWFSRCFAFIRVSSPFIFAFFSFVRVFSPLTLLFRFGISQFSQRHFLLLLWNHRKIFDRKQKLRVLYQACVFRADRKTELAARTSDFLGYFWLLKRLYFFPYYKSLNYYYISLYEREARKKFTMKIYVSIGNWTSDTSLSKPRWQLSSYSLKSNTILGFD